MAEVRGEPSDRNQRVGLAGGEGRLVDKAATADRAFARPRGDVERSETGASEKMVEVSGETANRNQRVGLAGGNPQTEMVGLTGESSNQLFQALEEWSRHLASIDRDGLRCDDDKFAP